MFKKSFLNHNIRKKSYFAFEKGSILSFFRKTNLISFRFQM